MLLLLFIPYLCSAKWRPRQHHSRFAQRNLDTPKDGQFLKQHAQEPIVDDATETEMAKKPEVKSQKKLVLPKDMVDCDDIVHSHGFNMYSLDDYRNTTLAYLQMTLYDTNIFLEENLPETLIQHFRTPYLDLRFAQIDHAPRCMYLNSTREQMFHGFCFDDLQDVLDWKRAAFNFHECLYDGKFPVLNITEYVELKKIKESLMNQLNSTDSSSSTGSRCQSAHCGQISSYKQKQKQGGWYAKPPGKQ